MQHHHWQHDDDDDESAALFGEAPELAQPAAFATADTLHTAAQQLEPVLRGVGLKQWQLGEGDPVAALNALHELVTAHQQLQAARETLQDDLHRAKLEVKTADKTIQRMQAQAAAKEQEVGGLNIKLRQLDAWYREEAERWVQERDELHKRSLGLEQRHVQFQHELRRRDGEYEKLQKHLADQLAGGRQRRLPASSGGGGGSTASSGGGTAGGRAPSGGGSKGGAGRLSGPGRVPSGPGLPAGPLDTKRMTKVELEELHKRMLEKHGAEKQGLTADAAALRKTLQSLEREHLELLNRTQSGCRTSSADACGALQQQHSSSDRGDGSLQAEDSSSSEQAVGAATQVQPQPAAAATGDPAAALQRMTTHLQSLRIRKQRVIVNEADAASASERLLLAKLHEAGRIMEEQEMALAFALKAVSAGGTAAAAQ